MFFTLLNFYILLSLSICFNCSWNFVSLWLWVALDLSFFFFSGNFVGLWMWVACCSGFKFFFFRFCFFFVFVDFHIFFFLLCCQIYGKEESRNFFNYIFFSLFFCMQFLLDFSFLGILLFGFNSRFVLVDI